MNKVLLRRIGPWSIFKFSLILYLIIFVVSMVFLGLTFLSLSISAPDILRSFAQDKSQFTQMVSALAGSLLIAYIIIFITGLISLPFCALFNAIGALIYNLVARLSGGIELKLEEEEEYEHPPGM